MKLARYSVDGRTTIGVVQDDQVIDIDRLDPAAPKTIRELLALGVAGRERIAHALRDRPAGRPLAAVRLLAPIPDAQKYLAIGMNYHDHAEEARSSGVKVPEHQLWFNKQVSCINGPYDAIYKPRVSEKLDYEAELGVVIGTTAKHVSERDALDVVQGYICVNDVSARDMQFGDGQWTRGKSPDTFCPVGPRLVPRDEIEDPQALAIRCIVNGETLQDSSTSQMIFSVAEIIAYVTRVITLEPGDLIATGTPAGVGVFRDPQVLLQDGDEVSVEIEGLGTLTNPVEKER